MTKAIDFNFDLHRCGKRSCKDGGTPTLCPYCGAKFARCDKHGGAAGAMRSRTSHKGICSRNPIR